MTSLVYFQLADYPSVDFIHQSMNESLAILHTYLRPQTLSSNESNEYVQKLKQTVRPLANIAAFSSSFKAKPTVQNDQSINRNFDVLMCFFLLDTSDNPRFVYLSYSKTHEKWNVNHAIERLIFVLNSQHFYTGIQISNETKNSTSRENDS